jgi:ABC-2 type transport system permease protein
MSTAQIDQATGSPGPARPGVVPPASARFDRVMLAEWTKLRSLRSTIWTLGVLFVVTVGFSGLLAWATVATADADSAAAGSAEIAEGNLLVVLSGLTLSQLAVAVLGVLVISSEYSTGGIRSTLIAVPNRLTLLAAKALVFLLVAFVVGLLTVLTAFWLAQPILGTKDLSTSLGEPQVLRSLLGGALYIAGSGMFGFALGALVRHSAGAITGVVGLLLVLPLMVLIIPGRIGEKITEYFTANAGTLITQFARPEGLGPWEGYAVFTAEWAVILVAAAALMRRRDA